MLDPLDRCRRDSTLFQFTSKRLRDFIDPDHLLIRIDEQLDFAKPVARRRLTCSELRSRFLVPEGMAAATVWS